jgi:hypothetical protein
MARCSGIRADGGRCGAQAIRGTEHCVNHHPDYEDARRRRNSKGGRRGGRGRPLLEVLGISDQLQGLADKVLAGELDRADASVCGQLLNYKTRALDVARSWRETEELAREVEELREIVGANKERNRYGT